MITNKVVPNLNMFIPNVKYRVFGEVYGANVVAFYRDNSKINTIITEMLFNSNNLHVITTCDNISYLNCG